MATDADDLEREQAEHIGYRRGVMAVERAVQQLLVEAPVPYRTPPQQVCGMVLPNACPDGAPVACAWKPGHLPTPHSWASLPTYVLGAGAGEGGS